MRADPCHAGRVVGVNRRTTTLLGLLCLGAIVTGCGDGSESENGSGTAESTGERGSFVQRANAICAEAGRRIDEASAQLFEGAARLDEEQRDKILEQAVAEQRRALRELEQLTPPPGDEAQVQEVLSALEGAIEEAEDFPIDEVAGGTRTAPETPQSDRYAQLATAYGLDRCAQATGTG